MTLDEAIEHAHAIAKECGKCADEHEQLAGWLEELKALKEKPDPLKKPDSFKELLDDVSKGIICYPKERVAGYLEDNHSIGEAVILDVRDRLRELLGGDAK